MQKRFCNGKIVLPVDTVVSEEFKNDSDYSTVSIDTTNKMGLDIGVQTVKLFNEIISSAKQLYGMDLREFLKCQILQKEL